MAYDFIHYQPIKQAEKKKLAILLHGYAVNGYIMDKMAGIFQGYMPSLEIMSLHGDQRLRRPKTLAIPKTMTLPPEAYNEDGTLNARHQKQWFTVHGPFHTWRGRTYHAATKLGQFIKQIAAKKNLSVNDIALIGFSQGGALALMTGFLLDIPLAAVGCHSAPFPMKVRPKSTPPTMYLYGSPDQSIADEEFERSSRLLENTSDNIWIYQIPGLGHRMSRLSCSALAEFTQIHLYKD